MTLSVASVFLASPMDYVAVDSGTTNSRAWLMRDREIQTRQQMPVGVRNSAIDGNNFALLEGIRQAVQQLKSDAAPQRRPQAVIAAGMITSSLGLHEVKHVQAPAGLHELSARVEALRFEGIDEVFYFLPGVRTGPLEASPHNVDSLDIMRGEETEIIGSLECLQLALPLLYIHLGSHTKLVKVDAAGRIAAGSSTLAGELLHSVQQQTVLRSSLPASLPASFDEDFFLRGWENCARSGLTRSLFQVRLLDLHSKFPKESFFSFLSGAVLHEEFCCLKTFTDGAGIQQAVLSGLPHLQPAWEFALKRLGLGVQRLSPEQTEQAFLTGLFRIFEHHRSTQT